MKKRPYLLLELLIGIALLSLFAIPLVRDPMYLLRTEVAALERMELERISEVEFANIKEKFYLNEIPWEILSKTAMGEPILADIKLNLPGMPPHKFQTKTYIWTKNQKESPDKKELYNLVQVKICFLPQPQGKHKSVPITFLNRFLVKLVPEKTPVKLDK